MAGDGTHAAPWRGLSRKGENQDSWWWTKKDGTHEVGNKVDCRSHCCGEFCLPLPFSDSAQVSRFVSRLALCDVNQIRPSRQDRLMEFRSCGFSSVHQQDEPWFVLKGRRYGTWSCSGFSLVDRRKRPPNAQSARRHWGAGDAKCTGCPPAIQTRPVPGSMRAKDQRRMADGW